VTEGAGPSPLRVDADGRRSAGGRDPARILLVGLRGAGKSTAGRELARTSGRGFVDLDLELEATAGRTIRTLIEQEGEPGLRAREAALLASTLARLEAEAAAAVVATGGGVIERAESRALLRSAFTVYLAAAPEALAARVAADRARDRPGLVSGGPLAEARALLARRDPLYLDVACAVVDAGRPLDVVVSELVALSDSLSGWGRASARPPRPTAP
jgi:shikimate kinase